MGPNPVVRQNVQIWVMLGYRHEMFGYRDDLLGSRHELPQTSDKRAKYGVKGNYKISFNHILLFVYNSGVNIQR